MRRTWDDVTLRKLKRRHEAGWSAQSLADEMGVSRTRMRTLLDWADPKNREAMRRAEARRKRRERQQKKEQ